MFLVLEIPDMPLKEGEKALEYIRKKAKVKEDFIWKDGIAVLFSMDKTVIKGPKISLENEPKINAFKNKWSYSSDYVMFYELENYVYCDTYISMNPILLLKEIPWIRPIKIKDDYCTRPVRSISLFSSSFNVEEGNFQNVYCGIKVREKFLSFEDFFIFFEKKNIYIRNENKLEKIISSLGKFYDKDLFKSVIHCTENPTVLFLPLEDKYMVLPQRIVDFVISKELMVFGKYNFSILEGFFYITKNSYYDLDFLLISMNSRLEDLLISYERDQELVFFSNNIHYIEVSQPNEDDVKGMVKILAQNSKNFFPSFSEVDSLENFAYIINKIIQELDFKDLQKPLVNFLINNYKNDHKTILVEEYPQLAGLLSYYVYENYKDYNRNVHEAFLGYTGEIKNRYGLLVYLGDKYLFLLDLESRKQLATSTKDPFGSKSTVDNLINVFVKYKQPILKNLPEDLLQLFNRRIRIYFQNTYGAKMKDIFPKIKILQNPTRSLVEDFLELNGTLQFIFQNYESLKKIMKALSFCKDLVYTKGEEEFYFFSQESTKNLDFFSNAQQITLKAQLHFVENILNNGGASACNNPQYLSVLMCFYLNVSKIVDFSNISEL